MENKFSQFTQAAESIISSTAVTHEQATNNLAGLVGNFARVFPVSDEFISMEQESLICNLSEGYLPYCPRYILPDYEKLMKEGCKFLRLEKPETLEGALLTLSIFYRHVPSVTHYPVYLGRVDQLLEPFMDTVSEEEAKRLIEQFLFFLSRSIPDSYCHMNIGPEATRAGHYILDAEIKHQEAIPSITLLYDENITPDDFAMKALTCSQLCAKPSFANHEAYKSTTGFNYGIASCYNALPVGGGALTLNRVLISNIAKKANSVDEFFDDLLPKATNTLMEFMDSKVEYMVEKSHFFHSNFLVEEGFIKLENFTAMVGIVGLSECVKELLEKEGIEEPKLGSEEADAMSHRILKALTDLLNNHKSKYMDITNNHYLLHAQVGIAEDIGITPAVRIPIGEEPDLYTRLNHQAKFEQYFPSGVGDIYPFDVTAKNNVDGILDIVKGSFDQGMQYFSTYSEESDVVRVTGYLVKRSDIEKLDKEIAVSQANATWGYYASKNQHALERKTESL